MQTAGELRTRCQRLHDFAEVAQVETVLEFLIDKFPPLVARLARAPGTKEARYAHLLSGEEALQRQQIAAGFSSSALVAEPPAGDRVAQLEQEVAKLRAELDSLAQQFEIFKKQFD